MNRKAAIAEEAPADGTAVAPTVTGTIVVRATGATVAGRAHVMTDADPAVAMIDVDPAVAMTDADPDEMIVAVPVLVMIDADPDEMIVAVPVIEIASPMPVGVTTDGDRAARAVRAEAAPVDGAAPKIIDAEIGTRGLNPRFYLQAACKRVCMASSLLS